LVKAKGAGSRSSDESTRSSDISRQDSFASSRQSAERTSKNANAFNRQAFQACRKSLDISSAYLWDLREELGNGAFGKVFKVRSRFDAKKFVAVKEVHKDECTSLSELRSEISILFRLDHPHVLRFFESYEDHRQIYIVTELCAGGDLSGCMREVRGDVAFARHVADQCLKALAYCHAQGVCHRDLKPENIFLVRKLGDTRDPPLRLADFGLARQFEDLNCRALQTKLGSMKASLRRMQSFKGTPEYMAPEVLAVLNAKVNYTGQVTYYDFRCDVWSVGIIVYMLLTGEHPYDLEELVAFVEKGQPLAAVAVDGFEEKVAEFLRRCLQPVYTKRPCAGVLMTDAFVLHSPAAAKLFALIDKDASGSVDASELLDYMLGSGQEPETIGELFAALDTNKDGVVSQDEFERGFNTFSNYDGRTAPQELAHVAGNLDAFLQAPHMKKAALTAAARHLGGYELYQLREVFEKVDANGDGKISLEEWRRSCQSVTDKPSAWADETFSALDTDGSGLVDYVEFLAGVMDSQLAERKDLAWAAFKAFDQHSTGSISKADLQKVLEGMDEQEHIMSLASTDEHGEITFDAFLELLQ